MFFHVFPWVQHGIPCSWARLSRRAHEVVSKTSSYALLGPQAPSGRNQSTGNKNDLMMFDCLILFDIVWYCLILRMIDSVSLVLLIIELFQEDCSQTHHSCIFWNIPGSIRVPHSRCLRCSQLWSCHSSPTAQPCGSVKTFIDFPWLPPDREMEIHVHPFTSYLDLFSCSPRYQYVIICTIGYQWLPVGSFMVPGPTLDHWAADNGCGFTPIMGLSLGVGTGDWGPLGPLEVQETIDVGSIGWSIGYTPKKAVPCPDEHLSTCASLSKSCSDIWIYHNISF